MSLVWVLFVCFVNKFLRIWEIMRKTHKMELFRWENCLLRYQAVGANRSTLNHDRAMMQWCWSISLSHTHSHSLESQSNQCEIQIDLIEIPPTIKLFPSSSTSFPKILLKPKEIFNLSIGIDIEIHKWKKSTPEINFNFSLPLAFSIEYYTSSVFSTLHCYLKKL